MALISGTDGKTLIVSKGSNRLNIFSLGMQPPSTLVYGSKEYWVLLAEDIESILQVPQSKEDNTNSQWRLYEQIHETVHPNAIALDTSHILVLNGMTPKPEDDQEFNRWYAEEHIPMLSRAPGWIYSKRYKLLQTSDSDLKYAVPMYLAAHAWKSELSFQSDEYKEAVSTPWRNKVVDSVLTKERHVLDFTISLGN